MRSIMRLYATTARGNQMYLLNELRAMKLKPKFDQYLHAFYFEGTMHSVFDISFRSRIVDNFHIQIGQPFSALGEQSISEAFQKMQFKNYLPLQRGLIERITLKIIIKESSYIPSENILTFLVQNALDKQILRKEYYQNIIKNQKTGLRSHSESLYEIREIVQRKWAEDDYRMEEQKLLMKQEEMKRIGTTELSEEPQRAQQSLQLSTKTLFAVNRNPIISNQGTLTDLPYNPELTLYIRKNKGRILLKVNRTEMHKHGWKKEVGWGPMRESLAAAILQKTKLLDTKDDIKLWDPFCGSGTFPLVAASMFYKLPVRKDFMKNFNWPNWQIYKSEYLAEYEASYAEREEKKVRLLASDMSLQAVNYTLRNIQGFVQQFHLQALREPKYPLVIRQRPTDQIFEVVDGNIVCICQDFEKVFENIRQQSPNGSINIITNLPYTSARSEQVIPLNQLISAYSRFSEMVRKNAAHFANVFVVINNQPEALADSYHFLNLSKEKWICIADFENGGIPIGLYAWDRNQLTAQYENYMEEYREVVKENHAIEKIQNVSGEKVGQLLAEYREKVKQLESKWYNVPKYLKKTKSGWRRVKEKRRVRHLQAAYEVFAHRRDKMIAYSLYARKKLEVKMIRRGSAWRKKNLRLLQQQPLLEFQKELKKQFQKRIEGAVERKEAHDKKVATKKAAFELLKKKKEKAKKRQSSSRGKRRLVANKALAPPRKTHRRRA